MPFNVRSLSCLYGMKKPTLQQVSVTLWITMFPSFGEHFEASFASHKLTENDPTLIKKWNDQQADVEHEPLRMSNALLFCHLSYLATSQKPHTNPSSGELLPWGEMCLWLKESLVWSMFDNIRSFPEVGWVCHYLKTAHPHAFMNL